MRLGSSFCNFALMKHEKRIEISDVLQIQTRTPLVATLEREAVSGPRAGR
jgi:hypothetical protein